MKTGDWVQALGLRPHPEGGFFREVFRDPNVVKHPLHGKPRPAVTSIQFMLPSGAFSAFHRVASSEIWLHLQGDPVKLHTIVNGKHEEIVLKNRQHTVPANAWQAAEPMGADYTLCACIVAPGFDFEDFEMATREALLRDFPKLEELVTRLTR
jgi:hypothetical protein